MAVTERLTQLARRYGLPAGSVDQFERLLAALAAEADPHTTDWEPDRAVDHHVADSLTALALEQVRSAGAIADIGAGAGFPGLPLSVALPQARVDLIESAQRKCRVIERLADAAGVANARAVPLRAEEWGVSGEGREAYDVVTARAVAPLAVLVEYAAPLLAVGGLFVAWKGPANAAEEGPAASASELLGLRALPVLPVTPFKGAQGRTLYLYSKERVVPERFPRRPGMAAKRPLA